MFGSLPTLHNCFMFANVTRQSSNNTEVEKTAKELHYLDDGGNATAETVAQVLEDCLSSYCDTLPLCSEEAIVYDSLSTSLWGDNEQHSKGNALVNSICNNIPWKINSDLGGIGVSFISFQLRVTACRVLGEVHSQCNGNRGTIHAMAIVRTQPR